MNEQVFIAETGVTSVHFPLCRLCAPTALIRMFLHSRTRFPFCGVMLELGAALTAAQGLPDIGLAPPTDFAGLIKEMVTVTSLPILAGSRIFFHSLGPSSPVERDLMQVVLKSIV